MLEGITIELVEKLRENNFSLTHLWLLDKLIKNEFIDIPEMNALERRTYVLEKEITEKGKDYYYSLITENNIFKEKEVPIPKVDYKEFFDKWWGTRDNEGAYPSTDYFEYKGRTFAGSQKKNIKKEDCKALFREIVTSGEFSPEEIVEGTKNHILIAKENSIKQGKNQISFIGNSYRYLRERMFSPFIKQISKKVVEQNGAEQFKGTDF